MTTIQSFSELHLAPALLPTLTELGYEKPTPIQAASIPVLLNHQDLLAQAQTGTGKTAAFALPILSQLDLGSTKPQAIVIAPTRELAIQVAEAFQTYAKKLNRFHVLPVYGGQSFQAQLKALQRGVDVVVGTPGRLMDHLRRGSLDLSAIKTVVLDEADEMLKMGFIDDVETILEYIPKPHQTALFSATISPSIQKISKKYLNNAERIEIKAQTSSTETIEQCYIRVLREQKLDVLTRFLEVEDMGAAIIFSRTKTYASELAEKLQARGYTAAALHGDMKQSQREIVIDKIKQGKLDIVVATDVAARGIDVERVTHVINYDIPYDTESYIHRIGRTGRAGRQGKAILFVTPREGGLLKDIERAINKPIKQITPPSIEQMQTARQKQFTEQVINVIQKSKRLGPYKDMIDSLMAQADCDPRDISAALAYLMQQTNPLPSEEIRVVKSEGGGHRRHDGGHRGKPRGDRKFGGAKKPAGARPGGARKPGGFKKSGSFKKPRRQA